MGLQSDARSSANQGLHNCCDTAPVGGALECFRGPVDRQEFAASRGRQGSHGRERCVLVGSSPGCTVGPDRRGKILRVPLSCELLWVIPTIGEL